MWVVTESAARTLVTMADAIAAVERAYAALDRGESVVFPVTMGTASQPGTRFGVKAGFDGALKAPGLKVGTYWPGNRANGLESHGSTTMLLDDATGAVRALVSATYLTALRTAAADAVAAKYLARADARRVAIIGAGHQAFFDLLALREVRDVREVAVWSRTSANAERFAAKARQHGFDAAVTDAARAVAEADIVVTATAAHEALVQHGWVRPGTHVSAMGADARGKQELDVDLVASASLFADVVEQSIELGEYERAFLDGRIRRDQIGAIGAVVNGRIEGRTDDREVTIFDSSGMALQDIAIAACALELALQKGLAQEVALG